MSTKERKDFKETLETTLDKYRMTQRYTDEYLRNSVSGTYQSSWATKLQERVWGGAQYSDFSHCLDGVKKNIIDVYNNKIKVEFERISTLMKSDLAAVFQTLLTTALNNSGDNINKRSEVLKNFKDLKDITEVICTEKMQKLHANSLEDLLKYTNQLIVECTNKFPVEAMIDERDFFISSVELLSREIGVTTLHEIEYVAQTETTTTGEVAD